MSVDRESFEGGPLDGYERRMKRERAVEMLAVRHGAALSTHRYAFGHVVSRPEIGRPRSFQTGVAINVYRFITLVEGCAYYEYAGGRRAG